MTSQTPASVEDIGQTDDTMTTTKPNVDDPKVNDLPVQSREVIGSEVTDPEVTQQQAQVDDDTEKGERETRAETRAGLNLNMEEVLPDNTRTAMFEEALKFDKDGNKSEALKCYLKCLVGLKENTQFSLLPQCLRNIGDIYYGKNEYDKAISFIQAEKLYYESVLIDDTELQKHIDEVASGDLDLEGTDANIDVLRAAEYEQLAKLCMDEKQPQLALEYAGKATKLRQKVYGDGHPLVQQSLDYFATVYAEVGKVQYTESMGKYDTSGEPDLTGDITLPSSPEPASILRKRKHTESESHKKVRFDESQVPAEIMNEQEERFARAVLLSLFLVLLCILMLLGLYIFCQTRHNQSTSCVYLGTRLHDATMTLRYWYYYYISGDDAKYM